jgi:hypothetical protein
MNTTHGHYVSELNNIFGDNWIITDALACHLLCIKYKIKSEYKKNINDITILYHKQNYNSKLTQSCFINNINTELVINITKPAFKSEEEIKYKITAIKIDNDVKYIVVNNLKIIHPEHLLNNYLNHNYKDICHKIIEEMNKTIIKYNKQIEYLSKKKEIDDKLISYLQNEINNQLCTATESEPPAKKHK